MLLFVNNLKCKLESCKEVPTLLAQSQKISMNDGEKLKEPSAYRSLMGSLLYLTMTRLDVSNYFTFEVHEFTKQCSHHLMGVAKRVLKYVKGTTNFCIQYLKIGIVKLNVCVGSEWAGSVDGMKTKFKLCSYNWFMYCVFYQFSFMYYFIECKNCMQWHNQLLNQSMSHQQLLLLNSRVNDF